MPVKPVFNDDQLEIIHTAARRIFKARFEWMKANKREGRVGGQEAMGLALGISQQSVSDLLKGKYNPGMKVASNLANLEGLTLEQLVGHFGGEPERPKDPHQTEPVTTERHPEAPSGLRGLEACIEFHSSIKTWSPWTIAAARAGYFGRTDFAAPEWTAKLDSLEKLLSRGQTKKGVGT